MNRRTTIASSLAALLVVACGAPAAAPPPPPRSSAATISLSVSAEGTAEGRLAWAWLPEPVFTALVEHQLTDALVVDLIEGLRVTEPLTLGEAPRAIGAIEGEGAGGFLVVLQPPGGDFFPALLGGPTGESRRGLSEIVRPMSTDPLEVTVRLSRPSPPRPAEERCAGDGRVLITLEVPEVGGTIGNDTARRLCVVLPDDYEASVPRRYPTVYLLNGYGGSDTSYLHLASSHPEAILVGVDGRSRFGTTYYYDTPAAGRWEVLLERAVAEVDRRFRTVADPSRRGLLGHSTGGYNAISLALRRTDLFMAAAASSPDGLDLDAWLFDGDTARPTWLQWTRLEDTLGGPGQMVSYALQLDDASRAGGVVWPFDLATGARDPEVWARWARRTPMGLLEDPAVLERARRHLSDRLFISVGRRDAFGLFPPAERFHRRLDELEIAHAWVPTDGDHFEGSQERREAALAYLLERL